MSALTETIAAVHQEAAGSIELYIVQPHEASELFMAAISGDAYAAQLSLAVVTALDHVRNAPKDGPALCGCCPERLRSKFSIVVAMADRGDPSAALAFAICHQCGTELPEIKRKALVALRRIWPTARIAPAAHWHDGGRA